MTQGDDLEGIGPGGAYEPELVSTGKLKPFLLVFSIVVAIAFLASIM